MFQILYYLVHAIQPVLVPLSLWSMVTDGVANAKRMHSIPCANCQYFTGDYRLKCTVQPHIALTEEAIDCPDYRPIKTAYATSQEMA